MKVRAACLTAYMLICTSTTAFADFPSSFVEVRCIPQLSYFSVHRFTIMNLPLNGRYRDKQGQPLASVAKRLSEGGILTEKTALAQPYTCKIPPIKLEVGSDNFRPGYEIRLEGVIEHPSGVDSYRRMTDDIRVRLNGEVIGKIGLNPYSGGSGDERIEISPNGLAEGRTLTVKVCSVAGEPKYTGWDLRCAKREVKP